MQHGSNTKRQEAICELIQDPKRYDKAKPSNQRFFRPPLPLIAALLSPLLRILPNFVYTTIYRNWPVPQLNVLRSLLRSPTAIYACLTLADEEMKTIVGLDEGLMNEQQHKLWLYFAQYDDWVGESREDIIKTFHPDHEAVRVVHGEADVPHAFCISESGVWLAEPPTWLILCLNERSWQDHCTAVVHLVARGWIPVKSGLIVDLYLPCRVRLSIHQSSAPTQPPQSH